MEPHCGNWCNFQPRGVSVTSDLTAISDLGNWETSILVAVVLTVTVLAVGDIALAEVVAVEAGVVPSKTGILTTLISFTWRTKCNLHHAIFD